MRTLALSIAASIAAAPAQTQTPAATSVANDLRASIAGEGGLRDAQRIGQLDASMARVPNRRWTNVVEIAPGVHRISDAKADITIEIKLRDATGAAHCVAFGPKLRPGDGALAADKFVELGFMTGFVNSPPRAGTQRRYVVANAPYTAELVAMQTAEQGDVVGFVFSDVPAGLTTRALSRGDASVSTAAVQSALGNGINICLRNFFQADSVDQSLTAAGFEFGFETGGSYPQQTYFTADNAVSVTLGQGSCRIETAYLSPEGTRQVTAQALERNAAGIFRFNTSGYDGCPSFSAGPGLNMPLVLGITNLSSGGRATCIADGTSRIRFEVPG